MEQARLASERPPPPPLPSSWGVGIVIYASSGDGGGDGEKTSECIFRLTEPFRFLVLVIRLLRRFPRGKAGRTYRAGTSEGGREGGREELNGEMSGGGDADAAVVGGGVVLVEGKECNYTRSFRPFFTEKQFNRRRDGSS